uniref:Uncharacterized protein n=1 Tax=Anguilla anguilla TaxID=7936 RepID=A0A0E9XNU0_ANGAN
MDWINSKNTYHGIQEQKQKTGIFAFFCARDNLKSFFCFVALGRVCLLFFPDKFSRNFLCIVESFLKAH